MPVSRVNARYACADRQRQSILLVQTQSVMLNHGYRHEAGFTANGQITQAIFGLGSTRILLNWTAFGSLITFRCIGSSFSPNKADGTVIPIGIHNLVVPSFIVRSAKPSTVKEIAAVNTGDVEPGFLIDDIHHEHFFCCIGLKPGLFNSTKDAKRTLNVS